MITRRNMAAGVLAFITTARMVKSGSRSKAKRAFFERERQMESVLSPSLPVIGMTWDELLEVRWTNWQKQVQSLPAIENVVHVLLGKTQDSDEWVVTLTDVDGVQVSFWLASGRNERGGKVRSISTY